MWEEAVFADRKKRVTEQLGEAMLAAVGLMVRQYMGAPVTMNEGPDSAAAAWDEGGIIESNVVNESFDAARYQQLGGEMPVSAQRESGDRAETSERTERTRTEERIRAAEITARERQVPVEVNAAAQNGERRLWQSERRMEEGEPLLSARALSGEIERDARRYDSGFYLY